MSFNSYRDIQYSSIKIQEDCNHINKNTVNSTLLYFPDLSCEEDDNLESSTPKV